MKIGVDSFRFSRIKGHIMTPNSPIAREWFEAMNGKEHLVQRLFAVFVREEPARIIEIQEAVADGDIDRVRHLTHSLKGASVTMGALQVKTQCVEMEKALKAGNAEDMENCFKSLSAEINYVFEFMDGLFRKKLTRPNRLITV